MKNLKDNPVVAKVRKAFNVCGLPQMLLLRIFTAFFTVSGVMIMVLDKQGIEPLSNPKDYMGEVNFTIMLLYCIGVVFALTLLYMGLPEKFRIIDPICTIASVLFFDWKLLYMQNDVYATVGTALVTLVIVAYALGKFKTHGFFENRKWWVYGIAALVATLAMTVYIAVCSICHHYMFMTGAVDFGLFVQSFHSLADNLTAVNSCERDMLMSHFNIHSSYIFYLFVPIFKIFPYAETLLVLQAIFAMGGIVPLMLILKNRNFKGLSMLGLGLAYVLSICLIAPCFYDFHENAFLPTLLMWTLWAMDSKKTIPFYAFSVLVCLVKEDAPLFIICIGLYAFFENKGDKKRFHGLVVAFLSAVYMLFITSWLTKHGDGQNMTYWRFGHLMLEREQGMVDVLVNSLKNPGYLFSTLCTEATLPFLVQVMLPLLFMPFFTKKIHRFLLMVPFIVTNLVVGAYYQYAGQIGYQYIFGPVTLLIFMSVINIDDMSDGVRRNIPILVFASSFVFFAGIESYNTFYYEYYTENKDYYVRSEETLQSIPENAVIGGDSVLISHLCDRKEVYIFDKNDMNADRTAILEPDRYDFIVLRINSDVYKSAAPLLEQEGYTLWKQAGSHLAIYKHPDYR